MGPPSDARIPTAASHPPAAPHDPATVAAAAFAREQAQLIVRRLGIVACIVLVTMGVSGPIDFIMHPERRPVTVTAIGMHLLVAGVVVGLLRLRRIRARPQRVALGFATLVGAIEAAWHIETQLSPPIRLASSYICLLTGIVVLLPWGWRAQGVLSGVCAALFGAVLYQHPLPVGAEDVVHMTLVMLGASGASVFAAGHFERSRRDVLLRTAEAELTAERERDHARILAAIERIQTRFIAQSDLDRIFDAMLGELLAVTGSECGFIGELVQRPSGAPALRLRTLTNIAWNAATRALVPEAGGALEFDNSTLLGAVLTTGEPVIANDPGHDPRRGGLPDGHPALDAFLGLPLCHGPALLGMIGLANRPGGYDQALVDALDPLAVTCASLITAAHQADHRRQAETDLWHQAERTDALVSAGREFMVLHDPGAVLERLGQLAAYAVGADIAASVTWQTDSAFASLSPVLGFDDAGAAAVRRMRVPLVLLTTLLTRGGDTDVVEHADVASATWEALGFPPRDGGCLVILALREGSTLVGAQLLAAPAATAPLGESARRVCDGLVQTAGLALARLRADLQRTNQAKSEFVSAMSHELRTPLNVILGYTEMAREEALASERTQLLDRIETAARNLLGLIEGTLEIGRMEAGVDEVRREPVPLAAFWDELGRACACMPRHPGVALEWIPAASREIGSDPRKLTVIVRHLVGNAVKFTETGGVTASAELVGDALVLRVRDTGIGIRAADLPAIFEMFRQADGSETRRFGGTGLGLHLVKRFAAQLGGEVTVQSAPGEGSTFTVTLPHASVSNRLGTIAAASLPA